MNSSARIWNRLANRYAASPVSDEAAYQKKLAMTREWFRPDMEVVEFGCGTGSTALAHAGYVKHIQALDTSDRMIEIGQSKAKEAGVENVSFITRDLLDHPLANESIDAVLGMSVLHLLPQREATLKRVYECLKPGGVFITNTVCIAETAPYLRFLLPLGNWLRIIPRVWVISIQDVKDSLTQAGFQIEQLWVPESSKMVCFIIATKPNH